MLSPRLRNGIRICLATGLAGLVLLGLGFFRPAGVQAEPFQWQDGYPPPEEATLPVEGSPPPGENETLEPAAAPVFTTPGLAPASAAPATGQDGNGMDFQLDWGFFWIGFAIPILAGCGFVLYLLDRRPELFRPRSKLK